MATPQLLRRLGTGDAVVIGLGSMIGAGVFAAIGPAAEAAGGGLLIGLAVAAVVAYCNATSSAQLAALYPEAGGTYVYGRRRLGPLWGFLAGWSFVVGKSASCAAIALTFGAYLWPDAARPLAAGAVIAVAAVNLRGVHRTAQATRVILALVLGALAAALAGMLLGGEASVDRLDFGSSSGPYGILQAAGLFFFVLAYYAVANASALTLGESQRLWPRPIAALGLAGCVVLAVTLPVAAALAGAAVLAAGAAFWLLALRGREVQGAAG